MPGQVAKLILDFVFEVVDGGGAGSWVVGEQVRVEHVEHGRCNILPPPFLGSRSGILLILR